MKTRVLGVLLLAALLSPSLPAQGSVGTVCLMPLPLPSDQPYYRYGFILFNHAALSVRIDKRPPVPWPRKDSFKISDLDTTARHLVAIISDGKPIQSFWFRFSDFRSSDLCLSFDGFPPDLRDAKHAPWCKCR